jgi:hypothetical protein
MITATKIRENTYHVKFGDRFANVGAGNKPAAIAQFRRSLYLEWVNDWLTIEAMGNTYGIPSEYLSEVIDQEREKNHQGG